MLTISEAINRGVEFHQRGQLDQAEQLYRQVLAADARQADAWHLLGLIAHVRGDQTTALEQITRAIELDGRQPSFHNHQGEVYRALARLDEAEQSCRQALRLKDDFAVAHNTLGLIHNQQGRLTEAEACFRRALEVDPRFALAGSNLAMVLHRQGRLAEAEAACREALENNPRLSPVYQELGRILRGQGRLHEAIDVYRQAVAIDPTSATAACYLGALLQSAGRTAEAVDCYRRALTIDPSFADAHCNLGNALGELGRPDEASESYRRAIQCNPGMAEAHYNLGVLLQGRGQAGAAADSYQAAVRCQPDCAPAYNNLGTIYRLQGKLHEASRCLGKALEFQPDFAEALNNLGNVRSTLGFVTEARVCYQQALRVQPDNAQAQCNLGLLHLAEGNFAAGWPGYESRRGCPEYRDRKFDQPQWQGEPLAGRRLLIHAEQGLGDTLQFARYVPLAARHGGPVLFEVPRPLIPLMQHSGLAEAAHLVAREDPPPEFDLYVPLLSLPGILGTTLDNIPASDGYLATDPGLIQEWGDRLGQRDGLRVGINWQGNPTFAIDHFRSIPLSRFAALARDGVELISLQRAAGSEQLDGIGFPVRQLGAEFDEPYGAFLKTAALMKNLDLVITSDTATAHLAGGLGVRTWVALMSMPDWRWLLERADCPWYSSLRLFRQRQLGDWTSVFEEIAAALDELITAS